MIKYKTSESTPKLPLVPCSMPTPNPSMEGGQSKGVSPQPSSEAFDLGEISLDQTDDAAERRKVQNRLNKRASSMEYPSSQNFLLKVHD